MKKGIAIEKTRSACATPWKKRASKTFLGRLRS
jgi:hypothetical protein